MNYFETSPIYCSGTSELSVSQGLRGMRDRVYISTKSSDRSARGLMRDCERSLKRMGLEKLDFYHIWNISTESEAGRVLQAGGALEGLKRLKSEGLVDHIGFTSHQEPEGIVRMIETAEFETVTVSYHLLKRKAAPALKAAHRHGMGLIIMTPLGGGTLADGMGRLGELPSGRSPAEVALRFLTAHAEVSTVIPGMRTIEEVEVNARVGNAERSLTPEESRSLEKILLGFGDPREDFCTGCDYCMPCPQGVNIPYILECRKKAKLFGLGSWAEELYKSLDPSERAGRCNACGECLERCPQKLLIVDWLREAEEGFG